MAEATDRRTVRSRASLPPTGVGEPDLPKQALRGLRSAQPARSTPKRATRTRPKPGPSKRAEAAPRFLQGAEARTVRCNLPTTHAAGCPPRTIRLRLGRLRADTAFPSEEGPPPRPTEADPPAKAAPPDSGSQRVPARGRSPGRVPCPPAPTAPHRCVTACSPASLPKPRAGCRRSCRVWGSSCLQGSRIRMLAHRMTLFPAPQGESAEPKSDRSTSAGEEPT